MSRVLFQVEIFPFPTFQETVGSHLCIVDHLHTISRESNDKVHVCHAGVHNKIIKLIKFIRNLMCTNKAAMTSSV